MGNNKTGGQKYIETMIKKHGTREAWLAWLKERSSNGGKKASHENKTFAKLKRENPEKLREISRRGGHGKLA